LDLFRIPWMECINMWHMHCSNYMDAGQSQSAYFLPEFALSPQGSFLEDTTEDQLLTYRYDDQTSRTTRSDEDGDRGWDAWGTWSECSRTCGGGASYSLRRCLNGENCDGLNIRYRTCSNMDCPPESGDFRAQQCSAHNDVKYQGHSYEWIPLMDDHSAPCALRCQARGHNLVVELAPKVLDGTRCREGSLDMCISGVCQAVGCDRQLGSDAKEDNCGVCAGDGSTCRLVKGQTLSHISQEEPLKTVVEVPLGSRNVRITAKGPNVIIIESHSLQGHQEEHRFSSTGSYVIVNTSVDFQKSLDRQTLKAQGPLTVKSVASQDTLVQFAFYQPIRYQWRETDFFPCSVTCGGGYQLTSAECMDVRNNHTLPEVHCNGYPENRKPKPKLRECNMEPCPERPVFSLCEVMPYDHFQPLPRWEHNPWTACTVSCGGGVQERTVLCVEENMHGQISQVEDWKCTYSTRPVLQQSCNVFDCPQWVTMEWSQCTVTCGRGLRYRVVLCIDHRGQHTGGCNAGLKPHIKEDCLVPVTCHKPQEQLPVEAKLPWLKQAQELEEPQVSSEEPTFVPGPWQPCSATCGPGHQQRQVTCRVLLTFSQADVDLPDEECSGRKPLVERACDLGPCIGDLALQRLLLPPHQEEAHFHWEHRGFTTCSSSCAAGTQESIVMCVDRERREVARDSLCDAFIRPPAMMRVCNPNPCPPRWEVGPWSQCSATCGVGIQSRKVMCRQLRSQAHGDKVTIADVECKGLRPSVLQACNQIDCHPNWHAEDWEECSHTCGEGVQSRKVNCMQLLSTGGMKKLSDDACTETKPVVHKPCTRAKCPALIAGGEWSKCSVTCGTGIQTRELVCRRQTATGHQVTSGRAACIGPLALPTVRTCRMSACSRQQMKQKPAVNQNSGPQILGLHRIYIQTWQQKRIHFTIGGQAYLLPKTSVVIKCPVRRFQKLHIRWEKDGWPLVSSRHLSITKSGSLKIYSLEASNVGVYRCVAGPVAETFILNLIGSDNRLIKPSNGWSLISEPQSSLGKLEPSETSHSEEKWNRMSKLWQSWTRKNKFYLDESQAQDQVFLKVLGNYTTNSTDPSHPPQVPDQYLEATVFQGTYSLDPKHFEELVRNISQLAENVDMAESMASELIHKLLLEASGPQASTEKWTGPLENSTLKVKLMDKNRSSEQARDNGRETQGKPVIIRQKQNPLMTFQKSINISIGRSAFLTNATHSVFFLCAAWGVPKPKVTWTKDGVPLQHTERVSWDSTGGLHVSDPTMGDVGVYGCTAMNELGSDSETSQLLLAEPPKISASKSDVLDLESSTIRALVGGKVRISVGANVTLECPVTGVPQPTVNWRKKESDIDGNAVMLFNGSLFLQNVSMESNGTYSCLASNPLGRSVASSLLLVSDPGFTWRSSVSRDPGKKRMEVASLVGNSVSVRPGELLHIVCPVPPNHSGAIKWAFQNHTLSPALGLPYRTLLGGRVLEVNTLFGAFGGCYTCWASTDSMPVSAWVHVHQEAEFAWRLTNWSPCSATCGNRGTRSRVVRCVSSSGEEVAPLLCHHLPRPMAKSQPCNVHTCPPSWVYAVWSECSATCGHGSRQRRVSCQQVTTAGTARLLPPSSCSTVLRPADTEECQSDSCTGWLFNPWGQCSGQCVGTALATQSRLVTCRHRNGSTLPDSHCDPRKRPVSMRSCSSELCNVQWWAGSWRECSAACGSGFQSRRVKCVHRKSRKTLADQHCAWKRRPITWQHCSAVSCGSACEDTTHYCAVVKQLNLCLVDLYRQRCCQSCGGEQPLATKQ
ncbi:ADAMTS-like protein 3, partial [Arapaima gigas]